MAVTDKAIEKLKVMISSGELQPGQKLPREPDLAASLGLSRNSLREAVRALSLVRILDVRQGDGTYVSDLSAESLVDTLSFIVEFQHDSSVLELLEVRRILEPAACARAAEKITAGELLEVQRILEPVTTESPVAELVQADVEFHRAITAASGNSVLASLIESLSSSTPDGPGCGEGSLRRAPWPVPSMSTAPFSTPSAPTTPSWPKCGRPFTWPAWRSGSAAPLTQVGLPKAWPPGVSCGGGRGHKPRAPPVFRWARRPSSRGRFR